MVSTGPPRPGYNQMRLVHRNIDEATPVQAAAFADYVLGFSYKQIGQKYGIYSGTVKRWVRQFDIHRPDPKGQIGENRPLPASGAVILLPGQRAGIDTERVAYPTASSEKPIGEQLIEYLQANLRALNSQLEVAGDPDWLRKQNAADLAAFHRVIADRFFTLANAAMAGEAPGDEED